MTRGKDVDDTIFYIADQIKRGIVNLEGETPEFRIDIAKLYAAAVLKAVASWDHVTAYSYSTFALSLLPTNCWESHYDLSLWFSIQTSKSCYSFGDVGKAQEVLQETIERCHSLKDKLPAYFLLALGKYHS
jgi:predicted ATPase